MFAGYAVLFALRIGTGGGFAGQPLGLGAVAAGFCVFRALCCRCGKGGGLGFAAACGSAFGACFRAIRAGLKIECGRGDRAAAAAQAFAERGQFLGNLLQLLRQRFVVAGWHFGQHVAQHFQALLQTPGAGGSLFFRGETLLHFLQCSQAFLHFFQLFLA